VLTALGLVTGVGPAGAQVREVPAPVVEVSGGWAGFLDDALIDHAVFGGSARVYVSPRLSLGPELVYMIGPGQDRDLFVTGNLTFDVLRPTADRPRRVTPFVVVGGGWLRHSDRFGTETFSSGEGAFTAGAGVRGWVNDRVFVAGEARVGWKPHLRLSGTVGVALGR
jgi:hypothetical protein